MIERRASTTLGAFIDQYIAGRTDAASNTVRNWRNTREKLVAFFGEDRDLRDITAGDSDDWRQALVNHGYADATLSQAVKRAKLFFTAAVNKGFCDSNPFAHLKGASECNSNRLFFVSRDVSRRVLDAAPDIECGARLSHCVAMVGCGIRPKCCAWNGNMSIGKRGE